MAANIGVAGTKPPMDEVSGGAKQELGSSRSLVPPAAKGLGALGALPFIILAVSSPFLEGALHEQASFALAAYGAVILSFLGGIHWGLAIAGFGPADGPSYRRLTIGVTPSLIGWGSLFLPTAAGLLVLAAVFASMLLVDSQASRKSRGPSLVSKAAPAAHDNGCCLTPAWRGRMIYNACLPT